MRSIALAWESEVAMAAAVVSHLKSGGWDVYQEVLCGGGVCDVVAVRGAQLWAVECKLSLGVPVVHQARQWLASANFASVAVPVGRAVPVLDEYCRMVGIGCMRVRCPYPGEALRGPLVTEPLAPALRRRVSPKLRQALRPEQVSGVPAGTPGGGYETPFKATCRRVEILVRAEPGITVAAMVDKLSPSHYRSRASARSSLGHWIARGKVPGVRVASGRLWPDGQ